MVAKFCEILRTTELYTLEGQISNYILRKLLFQEMLDFFPFYNKYYLLSTQAPAFLPKIHTVPRSLDVCLQKASLYLIWTGMEMPVEVEIAWEKGAEDGIEMVVLSFPSSLTLCKSPCYSETQAPVLRLQIS